MIRRVVLAILVTVNAGAFGNLLVAASDAHPASNFYPYEWKVDQNVNYYIDNDVPTGWRPEIHDGLGHWSDRADGRAPNFVSQGEKDMSGAYSPCFGLNAVFARNIDADVADGTAPAELLGALGYTPVCHTETDNVITGFTMVIDRNPDYGNWYLGDGDVPNGDWDMESIVTHEAGHATGFLGHFDRSSAELCPADASKQTMCGGELDVRGTKWLRSLESHDVHTLVNAYNPVACPPTC